MSDVSIRDIGNGFQLHSQQPVSALPQDFILDIIGEVNWLKTHCSNNTPYLKGLFSREYAKLHKKIIDTAANHGVKFSLVTDRPIEYTQVELRGAPHCIHRREHKGLYRGERCLDITPEVLLSVYFATKFRSSYGLNYNLDYSSQHCAMHIQQLGSKLKDLKYDIGPATTSPRFLLGYLRDNFNGTLNTVHNSKGYSLLLSDNFNGFNAQLRSTLQNIIQLDVTATNISLKCDQLIYTHQMKVSSDLLCELLVAMHQMVDCGYFQRGIKTA